MKAACNLNLEKQPTKVSDVRNPSDASGTGLLVVQVIIGRWDPAHTARQTTTGWAKIQPDYKVECN